MCCHFLLQGTFPIQVSNSCLLCLLHWQADSLPAHHLRSPLSSMGALKTHNLSININNSLTEIKHAMFEEPQKATSPEHWHYLTSQQIKKVPICSEFLLFDLISSSFQRKRPILIVSVKNNQWQLFTITTFWGHDTPLNK